MVIKAIPALANPTAQRYPFLTLETRTISLLQRMQMGFESLFDL
jgi:hypothetical protein